MHTNYDNRLNKFSSQPYSVMNEPIKVQEQKAGIKDEVIIDDPKKGAEFRVMCLAEKKIWKKQEKSYEIQPIKGQKLSQNEGNFAFIASNLKIFKKFVESQAKIIESEIKLERRLKKKEEAWGSIKKAFKKRLLGIELARKEAKAKETKARD